MVSTASSVDAQQPMDNVRRATRLVEASDGALSKREAGPMHADEPLKSGDTCQG